MAVGPLALIAAIRPSLTAAPITAAIVLLSALTHAGPIAAAADRVFEVRLGAAIGLGDLASSSPSSAYGLTTEAAARTFDRLAEAPGELTAGLKRGLEAGELIASRTVSMGGHATRPGRCRGGPRARGATFPDAGHTPSVRTLLRLRHDS